MRILTVGNMYPPHHSGGYELLWQAAVRALRAAGHEVRVLTTDHREVAGGDEEDPGVSRELRWYWRDHAFPSRPLRERLALERHNAAVWKRHVRELRPDVVSWWAMGGMSLSLIERARRAGLPASGWVIDDWLVYAPDVDGWTRACGRLPRALRPVLERLTGVPAGVRLAGACPWVCCSDSVRRAALDRRPELTGLTVEPLGVAPGFAVAPEQPWRWRLVIVGRIDPRKGIATAIEALPELPEATLRVVGGGDPQELARLRDIAAALGVAGRVTFDAPVPRSELAGIYAAADAVLFPVTWPEPFGLVPLEAMACGTPVLATGQGGSGDYLRDGRNALLHAAGDAAALAAAVRRLAADDALRAGLREGGLATAAELTEARWLEAVLRDHERAALSA